MYVHATSAKAASIKECFEGKEVCSINLGKLVTLSDANNGVGKKSKLAQVFPTDLLLLKNSLIGAVLAVVGCSQLLVVVVVFTIVVCLQRLLQQMLYSA